MTREVEKRCPAGKQEAMGLDAFSHVSDSGVKFWKVSVPSPSSFIE